jgi:hypothetical protein
MLTISGSLGHSILEKRRPSFLALATMFHVSNCSLEHQNINKYNNFTSYRSIYLQHHVANHIP